MFSTRVLSLWFFILSAVANASVSTKYPETVRFPKDLGPVQFIWDTNKIYEVHQVYRETAKFPIIFLDFIK